ncbi:MAG: hypothetical protein M1272_04505 [Firmicutes bacterium]|nr:hypothetical protein [Bacillota bacterium]
MKTHLTLDPLVWTVNRLSQWSWHQLMQLAKVGFSRWIFAPLPWPAAVIHLYAVSRNLAWAFSLVLVLGLLLRSMWPALALPGGSTPVALVFERLVTAAVLSLAGLWAMQTLVTINNAVMETLVRNAASFQPAMAPHGVLSPLVVLIVTLALIALIIYLAVFYAIRAIELYLLTAAIPWFALWWVSRRDGGVLENLGRELVVVIFIQSFHAAAFWLATRLLGMGGLGTAGLFMELALFWYMTKLPGQFRRLVGAGLGVGRLWQ